MKRLPALDVLRGTAMLMVLMVHYLPPQFEAPLFWSGVDSFFVLSGFLIAGILLDNAGAANYFQVFYARRGARILPLYWLVLLLFAALFFVNPDLLGSSFRWHLPFWSYAVFTQNFLYAARGFWRDPWLDVTWSLALEEQFYIFLSIAVRSLKQKWLVGLSVLLILFAPLLRSLSASMAAHVLPLQRADSLMLGVLMAIILRVPAGREFIVRNKKFFALALIPISLGVAWFAFKNAGFGGTWVHFVLAFFYADLLLLAYLRPPGKRNFFLDNRFLEWVGLRSYGIYLFHKPFYILFVPLLRGLPFPLPSWMYLALTTLALFLLAEISYRFIERPIMELGHRFKYKTAAPSPPIS